jgi:hypothetical protein
MSEPDSEQKHKYPFFVDAKRYETEKSSLTGIEINTIAGVTPTTSDKCAALAAENARLQKELSEARHALLGIAEMYSDVRDEPEKDWWSALNRAGCFERCAHTQEIAMPLASPPAMMDSRKSR